jgi:hypothetical protein
LEVASAFLTVAFEQHPADLALSAQQPDFAWSQVLASSARKAGITVKTVSVKQRTSFFILVYL